MIRKTVQFNDFWDWLNTSHTYKDNFSYDGAKALFEYLDEIGEQDEDYAIEYDPVAWCCEYSEYVNLDEFKADCGGTTIETIDELRDRTSVISETPLVIQDF
jgi:hypothetical protein